MHANVRPHARAHTYTHRAAAGISAVLLSVLWQGTFAFTPSSLGRLGLGHKNSRLGAARSPLVQIRAGAAPAERRGETPALDKDFLQRWDEAKSKQLLPSSGLSGWRAHLLDNPTALLQVEDFLDDACNIVRANGGRMTTTEFAEEYTRRHEGIPINTCGCTVIDWHMPNTGVKKSDGSDLTMGQVLAACTRLLVEDTRDFGVKIISLRMSEEGQEVVAPSGTKLIETSLKQEGGVSGRVGSVQSVLDYAVDEVLEAHGYAVSDRVVLFDGVCNLCNTAVNFILDHDIEEKFKFAALQSETGHALLRKAKRDPNDMSTMVLVEQGTVYDKSDSVLRIGAELTLPGDMQVWALVARALVPKPIRDWVYSDVISKNRVKWFGASDQCRLMDEGLEKRFFT